MWRGGQGLFRRRTLRGNWVWWLVVLIAGGGGLLLAARLGERAELERIRQGGSHRLEVYVGSLRNAVDKYGYLPFVLSINRDLAALLEAPDNTVRQQQINRYLEVVNREAGSSAIYLLDLHGMALASSNWDTPQSYIGNNYAFRPYFQAAVAGKPGRFYGVGTTSRQPGYFLSYPLYAGGEISGVIVAKVSLDALEAGWRQVGDHVLVADRNGVVFLSTDPDWTFKVLAELSSDKLTYIRTTQQYDSAAFPLLDFTVDEHIDATTQRLKLGVGATRVDYLAQTVQLEDLGWRVTLLSDLSPLGGVVRNTLLATLLGFTVLLLSSLYLRQRQRRIHDNLAAKGALQQAHDQLELNVATRTRELSDTNEQLQREIAERRRTEAELRNTQDELVQAGKLAVVGQMASGITHELNQPLTAMRTLSDNAVFLLDRGAVADTRGNLVLIVQLVERMGKITSQLRNFARKRSSNRPPVPAQVNMAVANALFLLQDRLRVDAVSFEQHGLAQEVFVLCDQVRLEQVLINLLRNAMDAVKGTASPRVWLTVAAADAQVQIAVCDNGPGIAADTMPRLFEPFFSTKEGDGLGLGLAISLSIIREAQGNLRADNAAQGGAVFEITLPQAVPAGDGIDQ